MHAHSLGSGPADALVAAARRLRLEFDPQDVLERFESHAEPSSLFALIEIAREIGVEARAYRCGVTDLAGVDLPAIVHFDGGGEPGFGLLVRKEPDAFVVEDTSHRTENLLGTEEFTRLWSGVVVILKRGAAAAPAPSPTLKTAVRRWFRGVPGIRVAAMCGVCLLALISAVRLGWALSRMPILSIGAAVTVLLFFMGAAATGILLAGSRRSRVASATPTLASKLCGRGSLVDCEGVLTSKYSRIGPIELAAAGFAYFVSCITVAAAGAAVSGSLPALGASWVWLSVALIAAAPLALILIGIQIWPLRRICPLCMVSHGAILGGAAFGLFFLGALENQPGDLFLDLLSALPWALPHAVAFLAAYAFLVPLLEFEIENRTHRTRLEWIASTPWGGLAEIAGRVAVGSDLDRSVRLGDPAAPFALDALVHATCSGCPPVLAELERLAEAHPGLVNVALHFPSRDPGAPADRHLCTALAAIGGLAGGEQTLRVFDLVKKDAWKWLRQAEAGPEPVIAALLPPAAAATAPLPEARAAVEAAERVLDVLRRGTPTVLLNGRPWDAPLSDLDTLLRSRPEALADALGVDLPPGKSGDSPLRSGDSSRLSLS